MGGHTPAGPILVLVVFAPGVTRAHAGRVGATHPPRPDRSRPPPHPALPLRSPGRMRNPRLVVVTGAGSGIGRATALDFGHLGATVIVADINEVTAHETVQLVQERGGHAYAYRLDVTSADEWEAFADTVRDQHRVPDVLVNNAGVALFGACLDHTLDDG